jgi:hypothetical protein
MSIDVVPPKSFLYWNLYVEETLSSEKSSSSSRAASAAGKGSRTQSMLPVLRTLFVTQLDGGNRPVRLLGVSVSNLLSRDEVQRTGRVTALPLWDRE